MKRLWILLLALNATLFAQQVNQDIFPASTGLNLGHTNQRWNAWIQNIDISGTCFINGISCFSGGGAADVAYVATPPAGACTAGAIMQVVNTTGVVYSCQNGTWGIVSGTPVIGTANQIDVSAGKVGLSSTAIFPGTVSMPQGYSATGPGTFTAPVFPVIGQLADPTCAYVLQGLNQICSWTDPNNGLTYVAVNDGTGSSNANTYLIPFCAPGGAMPAGAIGKWDSVHGCLQWAVGAVNSFSFDLNTPSTADSGLYEHKLFVSSNLVRVSCSTDQGTASINLDIRQENSPDATGTSALGSALVCNTTTAVTTTIANPLIGTNAPIALLISATSGTPTVLRVHVATITQ